MTRPINMTLVGFDGELELYADDNQENGILYDSVLDASSELKPLQVFFKWGNFKAAKDRENA